MYRTGMEYYIKFLRIMAYLLAVKVDDAMEPGRGGTGGLAAPWSDSVPPVIAGMVDPTALNNIHTFIVQFTRGYI